MIKKYFIVTIISLCSFTSFAQDNVLDNVSSGIEYFSKTQDFRGFHQSLISYIIILNNSDSTITLEKYTKPYRPTKLKPYIKKIYFGTFTKQGDTCMITGFSVLDPRFLNKSSEMYDYIAFELPAYIVKNQNAITFSSPSNLTLQSATYKEIEDLRMKILLH
jgi:hypothetical protein